MSETAQKRCPSCGMPASSGAAFCENCGEEFTVEAVEPSAAGVVPVAPEKPAIPAKTTVPALAAFGGSVETQAPFSLEWDRGRRFIEGVQCNFAFRLRLRAAVAELKFKIDVNGEALPCASFSALGAGDVREGTIPFVPKTAGLFPVRIRVDARYGGGCCEMFEADRSFEHWAYPIRRYLADGNQGVNIDIRDNAGIVRLDDLRLPRSAVTDMRREIDETLSARDDWSDVPLSSQSTVHERVRLRAGGRECLLVAGSNLVAFGGSKSRADVRFVPETTEETARLKYVSGVHFSIRRNEFGALQLRDGGLERDSSAWRPSTNGTALDGAILKDARPLCPGSVHDITLAPYAVAGGALSLSMEVRGSDASASAQTDTDADVSSILLRRSAEDSRPVLVVWGAAALDPVLGTSTGLHAKLLNGRLHILRRDGSALRPVYFHGGTIPGTSVQVC